MIKDEHDRFVSEGKEESDENIVKWESDEYEKYYPNVVMYFQKQYNLRSINVVVDPPKRALENQSSTSQHSKFFPSKDVQQNNGGKDLSKEYVSKEKDL